MSSVLGSVDWGKPAVRFLEAFGRIDREKPAVVYLRHSQADYSDVKSPKDGVLTEQGVKSSYEFGERLPKHFTYRLFHSPYPRAKISAEQVHRGLSGRNIESRMMGAQEYMMFPSRYDAKVMELFDVYGSDFVGHWVSGRFSEDDVPSSLKLAQETANRVVGNLGDAEPGTIDVYVGHDIIIMPMMFHWFGAFKRYKWVGYLDGFILQLYPDVMVYLDKEGMHRVPYPCWWVKP
ncbi:histidine phosphatase family protein [Candidatus Bathyarchaeota archaeon]|nr:histidine phosphatase family protein [Candidatus Bathyarchaeota archaeon]